jgi:hypothetical protein
VVAGLHRWRYGRHKAVFPSTRRIRLYADWP